MTSLVMGFKCANKGVCILNGPFHRRLVASCARQVQYILACTAAQSAACEHKGKTGLCMCCACTTNHLLLLLLLKWLGHFTAQAPHLGASTAQGVVKTRQKQQKKQKTRRKRNADTRTTEISCRPNPPGTCHYQTVGQPLGQGPPGGPEDSHCVVMNNQTENQLLATALAA